MISPHVSQAFLPVRFYKKHTGKNACDTALRRAAFWKGLANRPEAIPPVHEIVDVQNELRSRAGDAFAVRYVVEGPLQLGMVGDVIFDVFEALAGRLQNRLELALLLGFGFA